MAIFYVDSRGPGKAVGHGLSVLAHCTYIWKSCQGAACGERMWINGGDYGRVFIARLREKQVCRTESGMSSPTQSADT